MHGQTTTTTTTTTSNCRSMLEQLGIPVLAAERGDEHPLVSRSL